MKSLFGILTIIFVLCAVDAKAQNVNKNRPQDSGWNVTVGAGGLVSPTYMGDDEYKFMAVPDVRITYEDKFFASVQEGVGFNVMNTAHWKAGPLLRYDFGRDEDGDSIFRVGGDKADDLRGLGDVDGTVELGAFAEYTMQPLSAKIEILQGIGGHEGLIGSAEIKYNGRAQLQQNAIIYAFGPEIEFSDSNYHDAYFGVNANQSTASGLERYDADSGVLSYGIGASAIIPVTDEVSTVLFANYSHLGEEAANSSLVETRGSEHQGVAGLFVNYSF